MSTSPNQSGRFVGPDGSHNSYPASAFTMNDARNPRIDTIINAQAQQSSSSSGFDTSSPVSLDFNFPFTGSPHGSSNSGIDAPPDIRMAQSQGFPAARGSMSDVSRVTGGQPLSSQQHRASLASIDSAFDRDFGGAAAANQWTPANSANSGNQGVSNSEDSPKKSGNNNNSIADREQKSAMDDKPPAWSELKTKAGKERKRLPLACIACRRKKIRCSGEKPACKHCLRARVPCVYKVTTRKAAPRTDYMAMLDKRLKRMEDRVIRVIPKDELPDLNATGRSSVRPPLPTQPPKKEKGLTKKRSAEEAFTQELNDWTQSKQRSSIPDPLAGLRKQREGENKLFIEGSESLPPQHIQEHLAEVFFDCVYGQSYLLLHKPSFMRKLKAGTVPPVLILAVCAISARFSTHPQVSTEPAFLRGEQWATPARRICEKRHYEPNITILTAMLMLGLHYFGTCEGGLSWSFGGQAMRMGYALQLHRELDRDPLGRNQIGKSTDPNKAGVKPLELSFTDREIRRRTMWACYLMDTFNASGTERPSFLNEDYFEIQLPIKESHFQMEIPGPTEDLIGNVPTATNKSSMTLDDSTAEAKSNMGVAAYIVRGVVLWKRIVKYLNLGGKEKDPHPIWDPLSQFANLQRQITQLQSSLPDHLSYSPENLAIHVSERLANQFLFLHIILAQTNLFLHRFAIPTHPSHRSHHRTYAAAGMPRTFLTSSAHTVVDSAALISKLVADSTGHTLTVPFAGYCAYAAATVHVWGIFSRNSQLEATSRENLRHNYKYLTRMKRYWGMFHYMAESVKDIYRAFADAALKQSSNSLGSGAASLLRTGTAGTDSAVATPLELSRAASPAAGGTANVQDGKPSHEQSAASSKSMFQYGDWFDKYPHGVSEEEWESTNLEFRRDGERGAQAVMSQRSDLQSVEEFFASLSPPSKAEEQQAAMQTKKVARRRGKSVAENKNGKSDSTTGERPQATRRQSQPQAQQTRPQPQRQPSNATISSNQPDINLTQHFTQPTDFDMSSPTALFQQSQHQQTSPFGNQNDPYNFSPTTPQFNHNYAHVIPNLDRQMVFGAYAGLDPSISSAAFNDPSNTNNLGSSSSLNFTTTNPWDALDMNGFNFADSSSLGLGGSTNGMIMNTDSIAWSIPFNIEPPNYGGMSGSDYGSGHPLDGMDFGDLTSMSNDLAGSFSGPSTGGNNNNNNNGNGA